MELLYKVIGIIGGVVFLITGISLIAFFSTRSSDPGFRGDYKNTDNNEMKETKI